MESLKDCVCMCACMREESHHETPGGNPWLLGYGLANCMTWDRWTGSCTVPCASLKDQEDELFIC